MSGRTEALDAAARALLASDRVTQPTRRALKDRLDWTPGTPSVLNAGQLAVLDAVARRLAPLGDLDERVGLAARLEAQLAGGPGDGWRYARMPNDLDAVRLGLDALEAAGFLTMDQAARDAALVEAQSGRAQGWPIPADLWFEDLLTALVQLAYGHPLVQLDIGYDGMADAHGFQDVDA